MRIIVAASIGALLAVQGTASLADCVRPRPAFEIPEGSSAVEQDMKATQAQLGGFADKVRNYLHCLNGEMSQRSIGKDGAAREELARAHVAAHREAAGELRGLVECFTAQLEAFKSAAGGKEKRAADCSSFIASAMQGGTGAPAATELVVEASGHTREVPGGSWLFYLVREDQPRRCSRGRPAAECLYRAVHVRNDSDHMLECEAEITYAGADSLGNAASRSRALVSERETEVVLESLAKQGVDAQTFDATCTPRPKLPSLNNPAGCKYEVVEPVAIADYYPQAAREAGESGPVIVEFTLSGKAGRPTNVLTVSSSMYERLDRAAEQAIGDMVMSSSCGKARYRLKLNFELTQ